MMLQSVVKLPLSEATLLKLRESGILYVEDVKNNSALRYGKTCFNEIEEVKGLLTIPETVSALDIWQEESRTERISTLSQVLNDVIDGGFQCKTITELCGAPGSGKTQICLQACVAVQLNHDFGGLKGHAIYIDTRNGLSPMRLEDIAKYCQNYYKGQNLDVSEVLKHITVILPRTSDDLFSAVCCLKKYIAGKPQTRLVIVDSLSFLIQGCVEDSRQRTQLYFRIIDELQNLSITHNIAVVITNELTNQFGANGEMDSVGAGGQFLAHRVHTRLMLVRLDDHKFAAHTLKTSIIPQVSVVFQVTP